MFKGVTKWLGVVDNTEDEQVVEVDAEGKEKPVEKSDHNDTENLEKKDKDPDVEEPENDDLISPETKQTLEEVSAKAINTAKEWGSYLYSFGKQATEVVTEKAKEITKTVEDKTFLGDFAKEQEKFVTENKEREKKSEAALPPWVGYNEEESMKSQILALSQDKRNFLRNPPSGIQFQFDFETVYPVAMSTLQEDKNLQKMRFDLVPKQVTEETFWRNYFYRVSLIKQSTQLTSLAQQTGNTEGRSSDRSRDSSSSSENREKSPAQAIKKEREDSEITAESPQDNEFISDAFQDDQISEEDLKKEMEMLGVEDGKFKDEEAADSENIPQWEKDLQKELQDYEMVNDNNDLDDLDLENEILQQIENETDNP